MAETHKRGEIDSNDPKTFDFCYFFLFVNKLKSVKAGLPEQL